MDVARCRLVGKRFADSQQINANRFDIVIHLFIEPEMYCAECLRCICIYVGEVAFLHWSEYSCRCNSGVRVDLCVAPMRSVHVGLCAKHATGVWTFRTIDYSYNV